MRGWADFGFWRDRREGPVREAAEERLAKGAGRGPGATRRGGKGDVAEVRGGTGADERAVAVLLELNGMPRWVAFEERFIVAEGSGGRLLAALRYRAGSRRLVLGLPVVDPWAGEGRMVAALYGGPWSLRAGSGRRRSWRARWGPRETLRPGFSARPAGGGTSSPTPCARPRCGSCRRADGAGWPRSSASPGCRSPGLSEARATSRRSLTPVSYLQG